jgi:4-nitrophenyl phosphatase
LAIKPPQTYVFDLDGVIYRGNEAQPHASEAVRQLRHRERRVFFFTNNATQSRADFQAKLARMDIPAEPAEIMTSAYATALYLHQKGTMGTRVYVVGESGLVHELESMGLEVVVDPVKHPVDYVVAGLDRHFTYEKLTRAQQAILSGARFIATNRDATLPLEGGNVIPGGGALVSAIETASGTEPITIGKPETFALEMVLEFAGSAPEESVMVGDRLETDITLGNRLGMHSALILTGVADRWSAENAAPSMKPGRIIEDLIELLDESWCCR